MFNMLKFFVLWLSIPLFFAVSAWSMNGTPAHIKEYREQREQQDENYKRSLLNDMKKEWHKLQAKFALEIKGLMSLVQKISDLEASQKHDIERYKIFSNNNLQKNTDNSSAKIVQLQNELKDFIHTHKTSFTELASWCQNTFDALKNEDIQDDTFVADCRDIFDPITAYGITPTKKSSSSKSPSSSSLSSSSMGLVPISAQSHHSNPLAMLDPLDIFVQLHKEIKQSVLGFSIFDVLAIPVDEKFKTNGQFDWDKVLSHLAKSEASFFAWVKWGEAAYKQKNYQAAFVVFSLIETSFLDLPESFLPSAKAGRAIAQSHLGLMRQKGHVAKACSLEAKRLFQAVATFSNDYDAKGDEATSQLVMSFLPICGEAVYELSRMYQYGECVDISLYKAIYYLDMATEKYGHKIASQKMNIAINDNVRDQYTDSGYVRFIKFIEAEERELTPDAAYAIAKIFIRKKQGSNRPVGEIKKGYKWLAMAAAGGCLDAKYDLAQVLLDGGRLGYGCEDFKFSTHRFDDSQESIDQHNTSVEVICFCLWADAADGGCEKSQKRSRDLLKSYPPLHNITMATPISWHLQNACKRLPLVAKHRFPKFSLAEEGERQVLEIYLCSDELPTEVITLILKKIPFMMTNYKKKS